MTATLQTTVVQLLGDTMEHCYDVDPNAELDLTEEQRHDLYGAARVVWMSQADKILEPYGCEVSGNGEIIVVNIDNKDALEWDEEAVREALANIDLSDLMEMYQ